MISSDFFWQWVLRWRRSIISLFVLLIAFVIYLQQTIIVINVNLPSTTQGKSIELTRLNDTGARANIFHIGSIAFIPRDTGRIEAKHGNWQTTVDVTPLPWVGISTVSLSVEPDKNASKVSGGSLGCVTYDKTSNTLASYSCGNPSGLSVYKTSNQSNVNWGNKPFLTFPRAYAVVNFQNGVLGITNSLVPQLFYADMNTKSVSLPATPPTMDVKNLNTTTVVTDQIHDTDHFLLVNRFTGTIHFATKTPSGVTYRSFTIKKEWYESKNIQCGLREQIAYCYVGWSSADVHSDDKTEADERNRSDGRIIRLDFSSDRVAFAASVVPKEYPIDTIYLDKSPYIYVVANRNLYSVDTTKSETRRTIIAPAVGNVSGGPTLYYIADNKIYEFNSSTRQTFLRFNSQHLRLSKIDQVDSKTYVSAYIEGDPGNLLHTYELTNEPNTTPNERLIDKLPIYPNNEQVNIIRMDFSGNNIHVVLPAYAKFDDSGKLVPDDKSYNISKQEATNYLSTKISNLNTFTLTFSRIDDQ